jgi:hypothetical protein
MRPATAAAARLSPIPATEHTTALPEPAFRSPTVAASAVLPALAQPKTRAPAEQSAEGGSGTGTGSDHASAAAAYGAPSPTSSAGATSPSAAIPIPGAQHHRPRPKNRH